MLTGQVPFKGANLLEALEQVRTREPVPPGRLFAGVEVIQEAIHETADGKRLWVLHGDRFDGVISYAKWLAHAGDWAYGMALRLNDTLFAIRKRLGLPYWSLSAFLKHKVKNAVEYISRFEEIVAQLKVIRAAGVAILLVEQNLEVCTQLADRHYIIEQGAIVHEATNAAFLADDEVKDRYLGVGIL